VQNRISANGKYRKMQHHHSGVPTASGQYGLRAEYKTPESSRGAQKFEWLSWLAALTSENVCCKAAKISHFLATARLGPRDSLSWMTHISPAYNRNTPVLLHFNCGSLSVGRIRRHGLFTPLIREVPQKVSAAMNFTLPTTILWRNTMNTTIHL
jgi:hypothetical protein